MSIASRPTTSALHERAVLLDDALDEPLPPPIKRGRGPKFLLLTAGLVMLAVLVTVLLNIDLGPGDQRPSQIVEEVPGVVPPRLLAKGEGGTAADQMQRDPNMMGTGRAWIQATENGRLSQEYRYARSDPAPNGRIEMTEPEVKIYLKDNRVLTMRSRKALVQAPNKAIESGTMTGSVLIRMYEMTPGRGLDETANTPVLEVRTEEASYDNFQGDIHCPGVVDIQTATAWLPGTDLRLQINDVEGRPGQLTIGRINGELRLAESVQQKRDQPNGAGERITARDDGDTTSDRPAPSAPEQPNRIAANVPAGAGDQRNTRREPSLPPRDRVLQRQRDRIAERREARFPTATQPSRSDGPFFYRLTLNQQVRIRQGDGTRGWTATGDQLHIVFSLDNSDLNQSMSSRRGDVQPMLYGPAEPMSLTAAMASLAIASVQDSGSVASRAISAGLFTPSETDTIITCEGPLTMVPLQNAAEQPASAEDSRFELLGLPVVLHNNEDATNITCEALRYASLSEVLELVGGMRHPLTIDSPELYARGERFWVDLLNNAGAFDGAGWMVAGEGEDDANGDAAGPALPPERRGDVRIAWKDGVDLEFMPTPSKPDDSTPADAGQGQRPRDSFGRLRLATFDGDVAVDSPDFTLNSQIMAVGFPARDSRGDTAVESAASQPAGIAAQQRLAGIEFIHAQENVVAGSMSDGGSIACNDLKVDFTSHEGKTVPLKMVAMGGVSATDPDRQTVWNDQLEVTFKPVRQETAARQREEARVGVAAAPAPTGGNSSGVETATSQPGALAKRRADVDMLTATGSVQILMADGARVFADRLEADGEGNKIVLSGEDVLVASDRTVISKGTRLELTAQGDRVLWPGPGEFAYYTSAVVTVDDRGRVARPIVDLAVNPRQMLAKWQESMLYDALFDGGAGSIVIRGNVDAQSTPSALELSTMTGDEVKMLFAKTDTSAATEVTVAAPPGVTMPATTPATTQGAASQPDQALFSLDQRGRQLREIIATGDATMESRTWLNADHSDKPRVFYLKGPHIVYNDLTLEAVVTGKGELLVRDERLEVPATQPTSQPQVVVVPVTDRKADLPFGGKGTTMFEWTESLKMNRTQPEGTLYDIVMAGGVEVRHRALDQSISTMTGDQLEATVDRSEGDSQQRDTGFDLGGSMDLRRIRAQGNVYVDSPTRDVDCDEFDYNYTTGIARLSAREDRLVTVVTANNPHPVQARLFIWNTIEDTVQAQKVSGSSGR